MKSFLVIAFIFCSFTALFAQNVEVAQYQQQFKLQINRTASAVKVDGVLDDSIWQSTGTAVASNFFLKFPNDVDKPKQNTAVQLAYDDNFLYVSFTSYDDGKSIIQSLKRDLGHIGNDAVGIVLDPQNQHTAGFIFMVNALNAQSEDQLSPNQDGP
jgi:hypothetical protein